jgi:FtsH-binding integral membrane protein
MGVLNLQQKLLVSFIVLFGIKSILELYFGLKLDFTYRYENFNQAEILQLIKKYYSPSIVLILSLLILKNSLKKEINNMCYACVLALIIIGISKLLFVNDWNIYLISSFIFYLLFSLFILLNTKNIFTKIQ